MLSEARVHVLTLSDRVNAVAVAEVAVTVAEMVAAQVTVVLVFGGKSLVPGSVGALPVSSEGTEGVYTLHRGASIFTL